jgi:hypothetical protein
MADNPGNNFPFRILLTAFHARLAFSTLKMEAGGSSKTVVSNYQITRHPIPEDRNFENILKSQNMSSSSVINVLSFGLLTKDRNTKISVQKSDLICLVCVWNLVSYLKGCFENIILRKIFGPKGEGVTREMKKLHSDEIYSLYFSPATVRTIKI